MKKVKSRIWEMWSTNERYCFRLGDDGNAVLHDVHNGWAIVWQSNTRGKSNARLVMQEDGNLCAFGEHLNRNRMVSPYVQGRFAGLVSTCSTACTLGVRVVASVPARSALHAVRTTPPPAFGPQHYIMSPPQPPPTNSVYTPLLTHPHSPNPFFRRCTQRVTPPSPTGRVTHGVRAAACLRWWCRTAATWSYTTPAAARPSGRTAGGCDMRLIECTIIAKETSKADDSVAAAA